MNEKNIQRNIPTGIASLGIAAGHLQLNPDDFMPATSEEKQAFTPQHKSISYWKDAWRRLRKNYVAMVSLALIVFFFLFAFLGPVFSGYSYDEQIRGSENLAPMTHSQQEQLRITAGEKVFPHIF
jgi:oligopeptide transport system permease protein